MRRLLPCLALFVLLAVGDAPRAAEDARSVRPVLAALEADAGGAIYRGSWALVVGINRYSQGGPLRPLQYAVADARSVSDLLVRHYGFPEANVKTLLDGEATRQAILRGLTEIADRAGKDDRVIVYFSGHGHTVPLPGGGQRGYLVPADANLREEDLTRAARVEDQCVPMTEVRQKALLMAARHKLFLIDACYSGLAISGRSSRTVPYHLKTVAFRPMLGIIAAGSAGEEALENPELGHGAFTKKLLDGLTPVHGTLVADTEPAGEPDGVVTLKELSAYLCTAVPQVTRGKQNPVDAQEDEGQMLFFPAGGNAPAPKPPATVTVEQENPRPATATLSVASAPAGAEVWVGERKVGATPCTLTLPAAADGTPYTVEFHLEGYLPAALKVTAQPGATGETGTISLRRRPQIRVEPQRPEPITPPPAIAPSGGGRTWANPKDGMEFVFVPAGPFRMGSDGATDNEKPEHTVDLPGYWIGKYEVTVGQFRRFVAETGHRPAGDIEANGKEDNLPVVNVSWKDAAAYCQWAGVRLPTEAEWEKAARGTDGHEFVWGSAWPPPKGAGNFADETAKRKNPKWTIIEGYDDGFAETAPVGSFPLGASVYGCLDMAGNAWEWCSSAYEPYPYRADDGRESGSDGSARVNRGGSFCDYARGDLAAAFRSRFHPVYGVNSLGFRAARSSR